MAVDDSEYRTSVDDVRSGGFETELTDEEVLEWLDDANMEVDEQLTGKGLSERRLEKIEKYLTRHLITFIVERQVDSEDIGPVSFDYSGAFDERGLAATAPGQQVIRLDESNTFGPEKSDFWSVTL
ncbi:hypothetical protein SAMN05192561_11210 [Halopenitus malekzadehii]|uniref:Uncharacterized protein n=1 Tax=Halopenitus malekzadehii TaxID=1267564 RepID=A0A1H6JE79_9EURY|nr:hypothetical protein [Halopenitus malekzadehii]SEH60522.1 hypothetical protein SAMN05192561_11210 [Halopenitus malekzadehii]